MDTRAPQGVSTLELFFDLVFVFALTQVSAFLVEHGDVAGLARGALLLVMLWWMWSTFTWTTNWTGTETAAIRLSLSWRRWGSASPWLRLFPMPSRMGEPGSQSPTSLFGSYWSLCPGWGPGQPGPARGASHFSSAGDSGALAGTGRWLPG